jgi:hypothetical protein
MVRLVGRIRRQRRSATSSTHVEDGPFDVVGVDAAALAIADVLDVEIDLVVEEVWLAPPLSRVLAGSTVRVR